MVWGTNSDDTCLLMRRPLAVIVWVLATLGVTYVANAAVELVDLQVFPQGGRIRVLERVAPVVTTTTVAPVVTTTRPRRRLPRLRRRLPRLRRWLPRPLPRNRRPKTSAI